MHKNRLQEYLQKSGFPLPVYRIDNEGFAHAPKFRSTVVANRKEYKSRLTYPHRKEAEQDAAEIALKSIVADINNEEYTVLPDVMYSKSILNEYAAKMNLKRPHYVTTQSGQSYPVFVSTLVFDGKSNTGRVGKSKKEAEQHAAFATLHSLLDSGLCGPLHQIIKSKLKLSGELHQMNHAAWIQRTKYFCPQGSSSKQATDTRGQTVRFCASDSAVNPGDKNK